jgi:hypothetical protein
MEERYKDQRQVGYSTFSAANRHATERKLGAAQIKSIFHAHLRILFSEFHVRHLISNNLK